MIQNNDTWTSQQSDQIHEQMKVLNEKYSKTTQSMLWNPNLSEEDQPYPEGTCLLQARPATSAIASWVQEQLNCTTQVLTSVSAKASNFTTAHVNDVVFVECGDDAVFVRQVFLLFSIGADVMAGVQSWPRTPHHYMYSTDGPKYFVALRDIIDVCIYRPNNGVAFVLPPRGVAVKCDVDVE